MKIVWNNTLKVWCQMKASSDRMTKEREHRFPRDDDIILLTEIKANQHISDLETHFIRNLVYSRGHAFSHLTSLSFWKMWNIHDWGADYMLRGSEKLSPSRKTLQCISDIILLQQIQGTLGKKKVYNLYTKKCKHP